MTLDTAFRLVPVIWRLWRLRPTVISYNLTNECNERCPMCAVWRRGGEIMPVAGLERIFRELKQRGFRLVELSGGEPFLRSDLGEIFELLDRLGFFYTLTTNGTLMTGARIERLRSAKGLLQLAISLDSLDPATYARLRGCDLLPAVLRNLDVVAASGLTVPLKLNMTMSRLNYRETLDILAFARERGGYLSVFPVNTGSGFQHRADDPQFRVEPEERQAMAELFRRLALLRRQGEPLWEFSRFYELAADYVLGRPVGPCDAGRLYLDLHADGGLAACVDQPAFADLRTEPLAAALQRLATQDEPIRRCSAETPCCYTCTYNVSLTARHLPAFLRETAMMRWRTARRGRGGIPRPKSGGGAA